MAWFCKAATKYNGHENTYVMFVATDPALSIFTLCFWPPKLKRTAILSYQNAKNWMFSLSLSGVFAPTLFSKAYGSLVCDSCTNSAGGNGTSNSSGQFVCHNCHYDVVSVLVCTNDKHLFCVLYKVIHNLFCFSLYLTEQRYSVPQPCGVSYY